MTLRQVLDLAREVQQTLTSDEARAAVQHVIDGGELLATQNDEELHRMRKHVEALRRDLEFWQAEVQGSHPGKIRARLVCDLRVDDFEAFRDVALDCLPRAGDLIETPHGKTGRPGDNEPGIRVDSVKHDVDTRVAVVYCSHVDGDTLSARDLVTHDGWHVVDPDTVDDVLQRCDEIDSEGRAAEVLQ